MATYALLVLPSANRVYGRAAPALASAELRVVLGVEASVESIAGRSYLVFSVDDAVDAAAVAALSSSFALFEVCDGGLLRPVPLPVVERFDEDLVTIQRYAGKTNEQFTRLLLNVAGALAGRCTRVLDPVAGRGTTLNHALLLGWSAAGVEVDGKAVDAYESFLRQWLRDKGVRHSWDAGRVRRDGKVVGRRFSASLDDGLDVVVVQDETRMAGEHFRRGSFDAVVGDLPYGVQHGGRSGGSSGSRARSPLAMLEEALPAWVTVLRAGGSMVLAVNTKVAGFDAVRALLGGAGLDVLPLEGFEHRVDHAIQRDVVAAVKPTAGQA